MLTIATPSIKKQLAVLASVTAKLIVRVRSKRLKKSLEFASLGEALDFVNNEVDDVRIVCVMFRGYTPLKTPSAIELSNMVLANECAIKSMRLCV